MSFVATKIGLEEPGPGWFAAARAAVAALSFLPALVLVRGLGRRGHLLAAALGLTNVTGLLVGQVVGLEYLEAGTAAAILYTQPLLVMIGGHLILGEPATALRYVGVALGFAGVAVVGLREASVGSPLGVGLVLGGATVWAIGSLVLKVASDLPLLPLVAAQNLYGAIPLVAWALAARPFPDLDFTLVWTLLYVGVLASGVGWLLLAVLLRRGDAGVVSSYIFSVPLLGALFGYLVLDEPLHLSLVVGAVLVALGVRLVTARPR